MRLLHLPEDVHVRKGKLTAGLVVVLLVTMLLTSTALAASGSGSGWTTFGYDLSNTRYQKTETTINSANASSLVVKWAFTTGGDVSATPAIDNLSSTAYFPDWAGNLYAVDLEHRRGEVVDENQRLHRRHARSGPVDARYRRQFAAPRRPGLESGRRRVAAGHQQEHRCEGPGRPCSMLTRRRS